MVFMEKQQQQQQPEEEERHYENVERRPIKPARASKAKAKQPNCSSSSCSSNNNNWFFTNSFQAAGGLSCSSSPVQSKKVDQQVLGNTQGHVNKREIISKETTRDDSGLKICGTLEFQEVLPECRNDVNECCSKVNVLELRKAFEENAAAAPSPTCQTSVPIPTQGPGLSNPDSSYRNYNGSTSKNTRLGGLPNTLDCDKDIKNPKAELPSGSLETGHEWDFLTSLNEILNQEGFSFLKNYSNENEPKLGPTPIRNHVHFNLNTNEHGRPRPETPAAPVRQPEMGQLSPRPPRPQQPGGGPRRSSSDRRRQYSAKTKSMDISADAENCGDNENYNLKKRCDSPLPNFGNTYKNSASPRSNGQSFQSQHDGTFKCRLKPTEPLSPNSPSYDFPGPPRPLNNLSSSLDSIYEQLNNNKCPSSSSRLRLEEMNIRKDEHDFAHANANAANSTSDLYNSDQSISFGNSNEHFQSTDEFTLQPQQKEHPHIRRNSDPRSYNYFCKEQQPNASVKPSDRGYCHNNDSSSSSSFNRLNDYNSSSNSNSKVQFFVNVPAAAATGMPTPYSYSHNNSNSNNFSSSPQLTNHLLYSRNNPTFYSSNGSFKGSFLGLDYEERLLRLESDKDRLHIQLSCLTDQIEAQTSKIGDLEKMLDDKRNVLESTEDSLQRELLTRSTLETQKLELLTEISSLRLRQASLERENFELKDRYIGGKSSYLVEGRGLWDKPPVGPLTNSSQLLTNGGDHSLNGVTDHTSRVRLGSAGSNNNQQHESILLARSRPRTPPANAFRRVDQSVFGTLPRRTPSSQLSVFNGQLELVPQQHGNKPTSQSSGNLHNVAIERDDWQRRNSGPSFVHNNTKSPTSSSGGHRSRGLFRIFDKLKRSNSGGLDKDVVAPTDKSSFVRGGVRSTAAPRLGWMNEPIEFIKKPTGPVNTWDSEAVITWFNFLGLGCYSNEVRRWVKSGQQLLDATPHEVEKELGVKNPLHRKKLILALNSLKHVNDDDPGGKLDYHWVSRWLDDIGLPQYKENFNEARVDGRVLNRLTQDDLLFLKVTSSLHHASIKRAIQLLRIHKFHPNCLCRRGEISPLSNGQLQGPKHVATWTNHRVMEWLRVIDLSEYAPNMRGSGVHGALIIFEPKFNAELLSTLLSIPSNKTLLRRHLSLQVNELVGRQIVQEKRSVELATDFIPMSPTFKVKPSRSGKVFYLRRKRLSGDGTGEELLCPLELNFYSFECEESDGGGGHALSSQHMADAIGPTNNNSNGGGGSGGEKVSNI